MVFPSRTKVILYFFAGSTYFACSMYGFCPPMMDSFPSLFVVEILALERRGQRVIHDALGQRSGDRVQLVNPSADKLVIAACYGLLERGLCSFNRAAFGRVNFHLR